MSEIGALWAKASAFVASLAPSTRDLMGPIGAGAALYWFKGRGWRVFFAFAFGCAVSYAASGYLAKSSGMDEGLAGFLLGLFGMALVSKVFKTVDDADIGQALMSWIKKKLGVQ